MTIASDDFNRADNTDLGTNWDGGYGAPFQDMRIESNASRLLVPSSGDGVETWNTFTPENDQFAALTITSMTSAAGDSCDLMLRATAPDGAATGQNWYMARASGSAGSTSIRKIISGAETTLTTPGIAYAVNDTLRFEARGHQLTLYRNGAAIATALDTARTSGRVGVGGNEATGNTQRGDDWSGGDLAPLFNTFLSTNDKRPMPLVG